VLLLPRSQPCPDPDFTCSTLVVPLDHSGGADGQLSLNVLTADDADAPRGVLLFLTGGPGQPGVPSAARVRAALEPVLDDYRLVMLDQRGTGANALQCPVLQEQVGTTDFDVPTKEAVRECGDAIGPQRRFYSTSDTVADLELLRSESLTRTTQACMLRPAATRIRSGSSSPAFVPTSRAGHHGWS